VTTPVLKLKRGEDRRLRAGHLWIFSNEVDTAATPLTQFEPGAAVQVHSDRDQFLGFGYVNPRTLIAARIVTRGARVAREVVPRAVLPAGVRRIGWLAGTGARPLWRRAGRAERHRRHRPAARRDRGGGRQGGRHADAGLEERLRGARARGA